MSLRRRYVALTRNPISLFGSALTTASAAIILILVLYENFGDSHSPYIGVLAYLIMPALFFLGLILIPVGIWRQRRHHRRLREKGIDPGHFPVIDLNQSRTRRILLLFLGMSLVNIVVLSTATMKGVEVLESQSFCGTSCHVMKPEWTAFQRSEHSNVKCVECHVGPGADSFVKAKLGGAWQVVSATLDLYERPIPAPVHGLRPADQVCGECHGPNFYVGDKLKVITRHEEDETNTPLKSVLVLDVGGRRGGTSHGIHWHADSNNLIRYRSDEKRLNIYEVELTRPDGTVKSFFAPDAPESGEWRTMDCTDCHNRPAHRYRSPEEEVDQALISGQLSRDLPFIRREGVALLTAGYASQSEARTQIAEGITAFYRQNYPELDAAEVERAGQILGDLHNFNVFPEMRVDWNTYPDHRGHESSPGCFRCHTDEHEAADGAVISQDCESCHAIVAMEEEEPEILRALAL